MNWGPGPQGGFYNALAIGQNAGNNFMQAFQQGRQVKAQRDERNALAAYAKDPNEANFAGLADVRPDIAIGQREEMAKRQAAAAEADLTQRALGGEAAALDQLATVNFEKWKTLDTRTKAAATEEAKMFGQVALGLSQVPYEQRRDQIIALAQRMPQYAEQINEIAYLPPAEQDNALRVAITEAQMIEKLIALEQPNYQPLGSDQVFVNVKDPAAVGQFSAGGQQGGGQQIAEGATATNPQTGQRIVFRNGAWGPM